jgi:PhzF family phenazine biosynthesis protein
MDKIRIKQVDVFTTVPHTGNPAGVVLDGSTLTEKQMQSIAREMSLSETAFILPPTKHDADVRIKWFGPMSELLLCGHATVAAFHALAEEKKMGMTEEKPYDFRAETAVGILPVTVQRQRDVSSVMLGVKISPAEKVSHLKVDLVRVLNIPASEFEHRIAITRSDYILVPIKRLHTLFSMHPNLMGMAHFLSTRNLAGLCAFTTETIDRESRVHSRFFAPHRGIFEDPVTGSVQGQLAVCLYDHGFLDVKDGRSVFLAEQGDAIGRRGRVRVELSIDDNRPTSAKIGGSAVTVMEGEMLIRE